MACLTENEALAFIKGETLAEGAARVEDHVAGCPECQAMLGLMVQESLIDGPADPDGDSGQQSDSLLGHRVGNFVVTGLLGKGGMGEVYLATHPEIGRQVAVKVLAVPVPEHAQRFLNEARVMAALRHPNVVEVHDFGQLEGGQLYYVMELLRGRSLADVIRERSPMGASEVLRYLEQICAGLQAAHDAGVVHRDLKPANIIVLHSEPFQVKLVDFGLAKLTRPSAEIADIGSTTPGLVVGTPQFLAPEQAAGDQERIGPATDLYALGVVLHWMLSGQAPFVARSPSSVIAQHLGTPPPPLTGLPPAVSRVVDQCLAKNPEDRPASALAVARAFREALGASRRRIAWRWLLATAGAAVLVTGALVWGMASRSKGTSRPSEAPPTESLESRVTVTPEPVALDAGEGQPSTPDASVVRTKRRVDRKKTRLRPRRRRSRRRGARAPRPNPDPKKTPPTKKPPRVGEGTLPFQ